MEKFAILTEGLSKTYGQVRAVDGLNLRVPHGAIYGFLGRNGAGKSTTMKMLVGLARPTVGQARVLGFDIRSQMLEILKRAAFVGERKILYETLTPDELVRFIAGFYPGWRVDAVAKYARLLEIPMNQPVGKLSHGNRSKVCLLLALAKNPDLLILDEATAGLDPVMIEEVLSTIAFEHAKEGRAIFFSSHQLSEAERVADWVGIIDSGKLLLEVRLEDIRREFRLVTAAGNSLPEAILPPVISTVRQESSSKYLLAGNADAFAIHLRNQGATVLQTAPVNLREVFLQLVRKEEPCIFGNAGETPAGTFSFS